MAVIVMVQMLLFVLFPCFPCCSLSLTTTMMLMMILILMMLMMIGIIANPNCTTIIMNVPVFPLHQAAGVSRLVISTFQAASGAGQLAMEELEQQGV